MTVSFSKISKFLECPRKYDLHYNKRIRPTERSTYFTFGTYFHKVIENIITKNQTLEEIIEEYSQQEGIEEIDVVKFEVLAHAFIEEYKDFFNNFDVIEIEHNATLKIFEDLELNLIIDLVLKHKITQKIYIIDHKTTSMGLDAYNSIGNKMQPKIYSFAVKHLYGLDGEEVIFMYNVIKKLNKTLKITKKDKTIENFRARMEQKIKEDTHFKMHAFEIKLDEELDKEIYNYFEYFMLNEEHCKKKDYYPFVEGACNNYGGCEFKYLCKNYCKLEGLEDNYKILD